MLFQRVVIFDDDGEAHIENSEPEIEDTSGMFIDKAIFFKRLLQQNIYYQLQCFGYMVE